jgi:uncharacterized protein (TIGR00730 family)
LINVEIEDMDMKRIAVFCGSGDGTNEYFRKQAYLLGETLAKRNIGVVYGGAKIGMMGSVAAGALDAGGEVIGVLPDFLSIKEIAHDHLTRLIIVKTMHQRKMKMNDLADGFISLPGGFGTVEECFEILTWGQLGLHDKPVAILNINGFFDSLANQIQKMVTGGFLKEEHQKMLLVDTAIDALLEKMFQYVPPDVIKWIKKTTT